MESLLALIVVIMDVIAIVDVLRGYSPMAKKVLWTILIIFLPVLGMFLYFLLGRPDEQAA